MKIQQIALGVISLVFISAGAWLYFAGSQEQMVAAGISARVGFLLFAIWLAYPQMDTLKSKLSMGVLVMIVAALAVVAIRPQLIFIAVGLMVGSIFINGAMRRFASSRK